MNGSPCATLFLLQLYVLRDVFAVANSLTRARLPLIHGGTRVRVIYLKCVGRKKDTRQVTNIWAICVHRVSSQQHANNFSSCGSEISLISLFIKVSELFFVKGVLSSNEGKR
jgi:hypothetical protein